MKVLCWIYRVWSSKECACCACDPSVHLSVPSIGGFWDGDYVSQLSYVWYYVGVKSNFQYAREECESKRAYVL